MPEHWVALWASQDTLRPKLDLLLVLEHIHGLVSIFFLGLLCNVIAAAAAVGKHIAGVFFFI